MNGQEQAQYPVKVFMMSNSMLVIAECVGKDWVNPMVVILNPSANPRAMEIAMRPLLPLVDTERLTPNWSLVMVEGIPGSQLVNGYTDTVKRIRAEKSGIVIAGPGMNLSEIGRKQ